MMRRSAIISRLRILGICGSVVGGDHTESIDWGLRRSPDSVHLPSEARLLYDKVTEKKKREVHILTLLYYCVPRNKDTLRRRY